LQSNANNSDVTNVKDLNKYQQQHVDGKFNVYAPIEAYTEEWVHESDPETGQFIRAYPKPNTKRRADLPSLSEQWRQDLKKRNKKHEQGTRRGRHSRSRNRQKIS